MSALALTREATPSQLWKWCCGCGRRELHKEAVQAATNLQAVLRAAAEADRDREVEARRAAWERAVATLKAQQKAAADEVLWPNPHVGGANHV